MDEQAGRLADRDQPRIGVEDFQRAIAAYCVFRPLPRIYRPMTSATRPTRRPRTRSGPSSSFTRVRRLADRGVYERDVIASILDAGMLCHVAHIVDGRPVATPTFHWRIGDRVYWHGSVASRMLKTNAQGGEVCLTVTLMDGWVLARSAFNHTANYRSVLCFGRPLVVEEAQEKARLLQAFTDHWFPGRWPTLRPMTRKELGATLVLSLPLDEASAKVRTGGADDPARDLDFPVWAGVVPVRESLGAPLAEPGLKQGLAKPKVRPPSRARVGAARRPGTGC